MAKARAVSVSCSDQALPSAGAIDDGEVGHVRFKFAPSSNGKQNDGTSPNRALKKQPQPETLRKRFLDQLHPLDQPPHAPNQVEETLTTPTSDILSLKSYEMDLSPDIYEDAQVESSSAALARQQTQLHLDRSQTVATTASFTTAPETPPTTPHTAAPLPDDNTHTRPMYKSNPTTQVCEMHEICYSSQYTRPVVEMLTEVLEMRYPPPATRSSKRAVVTRDGGEERRPLLGAADSEGSGVRVEGSCCWVHRLCGLVRLA